MRVAVITLGCSKNRVDSEHLMRQLQGGGCVVDSIEQVSDLSGSPKTQAIVINTCGFIEDAKLESIDCILESVEAKKSGLIDKVYVFGCLSARYKESLQIEIPQVDGFFGSCDIDGVLQVFGIKYRADLACQRMLSTAPHYAYLKLSEGCDRRCSYCAIPLIRGPHVSRPKEELIAEATNLAAQGVKELILVAQDSSYYGMDLTGKRELAPLMEALCRIDGLEWIRVLYTYPQGFPLPVLDLMRKEPKICKYVDIPLQHIADPVLKAMRRNTTGAQTRKLLADFRAKVPGICIRTTLMVGHPGEDRTAFKELLDFVEDARFERMGAFMYSEEQGTYGAAHLPDTVTRRTKQRRYAKLMELQQGISFAYNQSLIGETCRVLIDGIEPFEDPNNPDHEGFCAVGRTQAQAPEVDGQVIIALSDVSAVPTPGTFVNVEITHVNEYDLFAQIIE